MILGQEERSDLLVKSVFNKENRTFKKIADTA